MALLGLIGHPVSHSLSPVIHSVTCLIKGLPHRYVAIDVSEREAVRSVLRSLHDLGFLGLNVTIPHKEEAFRCSVRVSRDAEAIGAVNVLVRTPDGWEGHNTDWVAVEEALRERGVVGFRRAVLIGAGGAARAAAYALARTGAREVVVVNRTESRGLELSKTCGERFGVPARFAPLSELGRVVRGAEVVVNAIPAGLSHDADLPLDVEDLRGVAFLVDLVYSRAGEPPATRLGRAAGCEVVDGIEVLARQAAHSFRLWTGIDPGHRLMEHIARSCVRWSGG
ncbi:MAG: shikimate dehydrogenase [Nitrososphaerota archaeon]